MLSDHVRSFSDYSLNQNKIWGRLNGLGLRCGQGVGAARPTEPLPPGVVYTEPRSGEIIPVRLFHC